MTDSQRPQKSDVAKSFAAAAHDYDDVAVLQRQTADELLDRLSLVNIQPQTVLDLGCGTGRNLSFLAQRYPDAQLLAMDIAPAMLVRARNNWQQHLGFKRWLPGASRPLFIGADAERLPLPDQSVDLVFANLALQWCDVASVFAELRRVLKPEGLLSFTTLGPDTLKELRTAWAAVDKYPHINVFLDMHDVGSAMSTAGFEDIVLDVEHQQLGYATAMQMMRDLKLLGASNMNPGRRKSLTGKQRLQQVIHECEQFRINGQLPASYEVIYGHAFAGTSSGRFLGTGSEVLIAVEDIGRR
ncbi:Biotin synthesis protein bioC [Methylophaga lonarensis MPL]|uniref:Malonyl-[acyl-carrier protein] O-methyltransferase n=1 Tax=Methylophaga lonarensis MPL TaxID=1286106 RepID=M7P187_9GAMM|nr:malonyl-ACP O-methyltransferase BioC [Methylophaga lonarensis]EMR13222.1 Biotin synthesis protein bioC [Methylophaga lonarensis MPL]